MLNKLRIQLTAIFLFAGILLIGVLGGYLYFRLDEYFRNSTDLALKYRLALELRNLQAPISPEIEEAEKDYLSRSQTEGKLPTPTVIAGEAEESDFYLENTPTSIVTPSSTTMPTKPSPGGADDDEDEKEESRLGNTKLSSLADASIIHSGKVILGQETNIATITPIVILPEGKNEHTENDDDLSFDTELTTIFISFIPSKGSTLPASFSNTSPYPVDGGGVLAALATGMDFRTSIAIDGTPIRYLTYKTENIKDIDFIQLGRRIDDQVRFKNDYLSNIAVISLVLLLLIGIGSWWLAGKAVIPTQKSLDQQQAFIANASHELRTPLTLIRASAELAGRGVTSKEQKGLINDVLMDVDYLTKLVEDLLLLSRLDSKKISINLKTVNLNEIFMDLQRQYNLLPDQNKATLQIVSTNCFVYSDPDRLRQLLWIFIDNALQNTPVEGQIQLSAVNQNRDIQIHIVDNGCGIPEKDLAHIYDRFYKARNALHKSRGAGLGLSIATSLVNVLRGTMNIESKANNGTAVSINLPQEKPHNGSSS